MGTDIKRVTSSGKKITASQSETVSAETFIKVLRSPLIQLIIVIATIFLAETIVMFILGNSPSSAFHEKALVDSLLLTVMTLPVLYFIVLRRLRLNANEFKRVEKELKEKEAFLKAIIETVPECIKLVSSDGELLTMNRTGLDMIEAGSLDQVEGKSIYPIINPEDRRHFKRLMEEVFQGRTGTLKFGITGKQGRCLLVETHAVPLRNDLGEVVSLLGITRDISERADAERALLESEEKYRSLVESSDDSIYLLDEGYRYLHMNRKQADRMGFSGDEYIGRSYSEFHTPEETEAFIGDVRKVFEAGRSMRRHHRSGRDGRHFLLTLSPLKGGDGRPVAVTVVSKDITELKGMEEKLRTLSLTDELTGLYNRRGFFTMADHILKMAKRQQTGVYMLYVDLDRLKIINDTWSHREGDLALIDTAGILKATYRESDVIARIGGDEFAVLPVGTMGDNRENIVARLRKNTEGHNAAGKRNYRLSMSCGISCFDPESPCSLDELIAQGDKRMYEQKMLKRA